MFGIKDFFGSLSPPTITSTELEALIDSGEPITIVDVRKDGEFDNWGISAQSNVQVLNVSISDIKGGVTSKYSDKINNDRHVIVACSDGKRSGVAATGLLNDDIEASLLEGGLNEWR